MTAWLQRSRPLDRFDIDLVARRVTARFSCRGCGGLRRSSGPRRALAGLELEKLGLCFAPSDVGCGGSLAGSGCFLDELDGALMGTSSSL